MSKYVEANLIKNEEVLYEAKTSLKAMIPLFIVAFLLLFAYGIGILLFIWGFIAYKTTELVITNKRVIAKFGFISRKTIELNIDKVESVQVHQGILGRMLNYGTVIISGAGNPQAPIPKISNPLTFRNKFFEIQEDIKTKS